MLVVLLAVSVTLIASLPFVSTMSVIGLLAKRRKQPIAAAALAGPTTAMAVCLRRCWDAATLRTILEFRRSEMPADRDIRVEKGDFCRLAWNNPEMQHMRSRAGKGAKASQMDLRLVSR